MKNTIQTTLENHKAQLIKKEKAEEAEAAYLKSLPDRFLLVYEGLLKSKMDEINQTLQSNGFDTNIHFTKDGDCVNNTDWSPEIRISFSKDDYSPSEIGKACIRIGVMRSKGAAYLYGSDASNLGSAWVDHRYLQPEQISAHLVEEFSAKVLTMYLAKTEKNKGN